MSGRHHARTGAVPLFVPCALIAAAPLLGCSGQASDRPGSGTLGVSGDTTPPVFTLAPSIAPNGNPAVPLAARVTFETNELTRATLLVDDGERKFEHSPDTLATVHELAVLGVRPDRTVRVSVEVRDESGNRAAASAGTWLTPPLPSSFPPLDVSVSNPKLMEPGVTLFDVPGVNGARLIMVDVGGEVVWYYTGPFGIRDVRRLSNGNLLYTYGNKGITEIDMFGNVIQTWWAARLDATQAPALATLVWTDTFHHDVIELPDHWEGDFMALSTEARLLPNYPSDYLGVDPPDPCALVIGDIVVEFRRDGSVVRDWSLLDILDPYRIGYGSLHGHWNNLYGDGSRDWSHGNSVVIDPADDGILVSARSQDAVVKFDPDTQDIHWILGPHEGWRLPWSERLLGHTEPAEGFVWSYHQHSPEIGPDGNLLLFDNGGARAVPPDPELPQDERYSRAVEFRIDEGLGVQTVWSYGSPADPWYSSIVGDADRQPITNNVLICDGGKAWMGHQGYARILEVTGDANPEIVFEMTLLDLVNDPPLNWIVYRAERLPSVYP